VRYVLEYGADNDVDVDPLLYEIVKDNMTHDLTFKRKLSVHEKTVSAANVIQLLSFKKHKEVILIFFHPSDASSLWNKYKDDF